MTAVAAKRAALVVAAHEFTDPTFQKLRSPVQDVDALGRVLGDETIGAFDVDMVVNEPNSVVQQRLERFFSDRSPGDLLLLYFSCHGVKDPTGRLYFVTSNTTFELLRSTGISASFVSEQMEYSRSKRIVLLLDCCYSGAFLKGFRARSDDSVAVDQLEGRGRAIITASRATEYAFEADELAAERAQPSIFTGAVVEGLATGKADANGDGLVTVDELYDYVYDSVRGRVAGQTPGRWVHVEGELVIARNPAPMPKPAPLPLELQRAVESDLALQRLGAAAELAQWLASDDNARRLAAQPLLELLARDYDERVKAAATAALDGAPVAATTVAPPIPMTADAEKRPAARTPEDSPDIVLAPVDRPTLAGWLAGVGALAVLLAPYFSYLLFGYYDSALEERRWHALGTFVVFAPAAYATYCLVRDTREAIRGMVVLAALVPVAVGDSMAGIAEFVHDSSDPGVGLGWWLHNGGFLLVAVAGTIAITRLRSHLVIRFEPAASSARAVVTTVAALGIGAASAFGWAQALGASGDAFLGLSDAVVDLVVRLTTVLAIVSLAPRWLSAPGVSGRVLVGTTALLASAIATVFVLSDDMTGEEAYAAAIAVLAMGAIVVPTLSTLVRPACYRPWLVGAWAVGSIAWIPAMLDADSEAGLLGVTLAVAAAFGYVLSKQPDAQAVVRR